MHHGMCLMTHDLGFPIICDVIKGRSNKHHNRLDTNPENPTIQSRDKTHMDLWGCSSKTNIDIIQRLQSKILGAMANAPWYVSNDALHNDIGIPIISDVIKKRRKKHHNRLETHTNPLMQPLLEEPNFRRLKRRLPIDLK
jgi:hypothetical protein